METKNILLSKTIFGALLVIFAPLANQLFGLHIDEALQKDVADRAAEALQVIGGLIAIYGRIVATKKVKVV